jgi:hypothetical protein
MYVQNVSAMKKIKNKICLDTVCASGIGLSIGSLMGLTFACIICLLQ